MQSCVWDVVVCVCVFLCVPWPNWHHGFWRIESCSSGSKASSLRLSFSSRYNFFFCHFVTLPCLSTFCLNSSMLPRSLYPPTKVNSSVAGRRTLLQPVKLSITMTASPASLTGLLNSSFTGWLCSGFLCLWSSLVRVRERMEGRVQMRTCEAFLRGGCSSTAVSLLLLL